MKNKKISKSCDHIISVIHRWNRLNEPKNMNYTENEISKMSNFGKLIFISPISKLQLKCTVSFNNDLEILEFESTIQLGQVSILDKKKSFH